MLMVILSHVMVTVFCWNCEIHNMSRAKVSGDWKGALVTRFSPSVSQYSGRHSGVRCASSICCQKKQMPSPDLMTLVLDFLVLFSLRVVLSKYFTRDIHTEDHKNKCVAPRHSVP